MKDGEIVEYANRIYQFKLFLPCSECCFVSDADGECDCPVDIPYCCNGGFVFLSSN